MAKPLRGGSPRDVKPADLVKWLRSLDRKTVIQWTIIGGALVAFIFFFFLPILGQNSQLLNEKKMLQFMIQQASAKIARISEMKKQKELYGARISGIRGQFFETEQKDELIKIISSVARTTGVRISASEPSKKNVELPPPFGGQYETVSYELIVEGSYHDLGMFINGLERYAKHFVIFELHIAKEKREEARLLESTFTLTAFVKRLPGAPEEPSMPQIPPIIPGMEGMVPGGFPPREK
ncbi:MAG: hypothetical protein A3G87_02640 [Omnitrophica bacterium RIFCSPLOWO2_12_FULL_50_11]|nr:MAG: hypothetical protein A3G87_02640 [Omnitrophica bacterium RIFCSPLOWO2_12_FULL_50_11]